jgi:hypothetical protein
MRNSPLGVNVFFGPGKTLSQKLEFMLTLSLQQFQRVIIGNLPINAAHPATVADQSA